VKVEKRQDFVSNTSHYPYIAAVMSLNIPVEGLKEAGLLADGE
jgi:hypothetical protein